MNPTPNPPTGVPNVVEEHDSLLSACEALLDQYMNLIEGRDYQSPAQQQAAIRASEAIAKARGQ